MREITHNPKSGCGTEGSDGQSGHHEHKQTTFHETGVGMPRMTWRHRGTRHIAEPLQTRSVTYYLIIITIPTNIMHLPLSLDTNEIKIE